MPLRLFIAIDLPDDVRRKLSTLASPLPGVVWSRPEQLHLTLRFLGAIDETKVPALEEALATVRCASFELTVAGCGLFPMDGLPRVIWASLRPTGQLLHLRQQIDDALLGLSLPPDKEAFNPHITLGRIKTKPAESVQREVVTFLRDYQANHTPSFQVGEFGLYESKLRPKGVVHSMQRRFLLQPDQLASSSSLAGTFSALHAEPSFDVSDEPKNPDENNDNQEDLEEPWKYLGAGETTTGPVSWEVRIWARAESDGSYTVRLFGEALEAGDPPNEMEPLCCPDASSTIEAIKEWGLRLEPEELPTVQ